MAGLFKTTIVIWTPYDPAASAVSDLARDSESGGQAMCVSDESVFVEDPTSDEHPPEMGFFFPPPDLDKDSVADQRPPAASNSTSQ